MTTSAAAPGIKGLAFGTMLTLCFMATNVQAESISEQDYDYHVTEEQISAFVPAILEYERLTHEISVRAGIAREDPDMLADEFNSRLADILMQADMTLDEFNKLNLLTRSAPVLQQAFFEKLDSIDDELIELAQEPQTFEDVQALLQGQVHYPVTPDMVPGLETDDSDQSSRSHQMDNPVNQFQKR